MKKVILLIFVVAFSFVTKAQTSDQKWGIGIGLGAYGSLSDGGGIGLMPEGYFSRYLSPRLDLILKGNLGVWNSGIKSTMDLAYPSLNLRLKLSGEDKKFRPYLYGGGGMLADNSDVGASFNLGFGGKYYFKPNAALYFDAGYINGIDAVVKGKDVHDNIWKVTAGIEVDFGKVKDADMDGVSDKKDKCPNTPTGVTVDDAGCPVDTDGDGVADYLDDCPTVAGLASFKGCPDKDKDGVADKDDACPDVPGVAALKGCPDADGDGVTDSADKCPGTKKGYKVDASGCPMDKDKDGVIDEEDGCPTVAGPASNKGCPVVVPVAVDPKPTSDNVNFDFNKWAIRADQKGNVDKIINLLKTNPTYKVNITGHADEKGTDEYNMKLSQQRADAVVKSMTKAGIKKAQILSSKGMGKTKPIATNDSEEGRAKNRRVEFDIVK